MHMQQALKSLAMSIIMLTKYIQASAPPFDPNEETNEGSEMNKMLNLLVNVYVIFLFPNRTACFKRAKFK